MKRKILILFGIICVISTTACKRNECDAIRFKKDYESINGEINSSGKQHRTVDIKEDNPFVFTTPKSIIEKIERKETFYVYFGSKLCPWCRSVIEKSIEIANKYGIKKIYYIDIWDDSGNEILRDKYIKDDNGKTIKINNGTDEYFKLLDYFDNILSEYEIDENTKEKRIYAPNFIYVENGKAVRLTTGISEKQQSSRDILTKKILDDEKKQFENFFASSCDKNC